MSDQAEFRDFSHGLGYPYGQEYVPKRVTSNRIVFDKAGDVVLPADIPPVIDTKVAAPRVAEAHLYAGGTVSRAAAIWESNPFGQ